MMANNEDIRQMEEEDTELETLEYTDEEGKEHILVIDAKFDVDGMQYAAFFEVDPEFSTKGTTMIMTTIMTTMTMRTKRNSSRIT